MKKQKGVFFMKHRVVRTATSRQTDDEFRASSVVYCSSSAQSLHQRPTASARHHTFQHVYSEIWTDAFDHRCCDY